MSDLQTFIQAVELAEINGLQFLRCETGDMAIICQNPHEDNLTIEMMDATDGEESVRIGCATGVYDLDGEEEFALCCFLAARQPEEVRKFLDGLEQSSNE